MADDVRPSTRDWSLTGETDDTEPAEAELVPDWVSHPVKRAFLGSFASCGNVRTAAKAAGCSRQAHYEWMRVDPDYAEAFRYAREEAIEVLEAEARRRAVEGTEEPVRNHKGEIVGTVRKYSDLLLIFLMKGMRPEVYRDRWQGQTNMGPEAPAGVSPDEVAIADRVSAYLQGVDDARALAPAPVEESGPVD